jgi:hypothetical protein
MTPQWTQTPPSAPGFYLYFEKESESYIPEVMRVTDESEGKLLCRWKTPTGYESWKHHVTSPSNVPKSYWLCGPIPEWINPNYYNWGDDAIPEY